MNVTQNDLAQLYERIHTARIRMDKVEAFREDQSYYKSQTLKKMRQILISAFQPDSKLSNLKNLEILFKKQVKDLITRTELEMKSLIVRKNVIDHPMHIQKIMQLFNSLDAEVKAQYYEEIELLQTVFSVIKEDVDRRLMPLLQQQLNLLRKLLNNYSVIDLIEYIGVNHQTTFDAQFAVKQIKPRISLISKKNKSILKILMRA